MEPNDSARKDGGAGSGASKAAHHHSSGRFINPWASFNKEFAKTTVSLAAKTPREPVKDGTFLHRPQNEKKTMDQLSLQCVERLTVLCC